MPMITVRYYEPDLIRVYRTQSAALSWLKNPESYMMRYSSDPSILLEELGGQEWNAPANAIELSRKIFNLRPGDLMGEIVHLDAVVDDLNQEPGGDIGLYADIIYLPEPEQLDEFVDA